MNYHPYITGSNRVPSTSDRMEVFGPGTDPAGLGTLGAPVNTAHVFEYLGENVPPFGNPQQFVGRGARQWEEGFQDVYQGRFVNREQDRLSPDTSTITLDDPTALISRPDELTEHKNNAQIARERTQQSVRTYDSAPSADVLANRVNADAEMRNLHSQAVSMAYESQMDAIRATHLGQKARGAALRGETIGMMSSPAPATFSRITSRVNIPTGPTKTVFSPYTPFVPASGFGAGVPTSSTNSQTSSSGKMQMMSMGNEDLGDTIVYTEDVPDFAQTYQDSYYDPTKIALILGGLGIAAVAAFFVFRGR